MVDVAVVGGGASGLCAAIAAAEEGASVVLCEAGERVGAKILATGNGRCNLTNMGLTPQDYNRPLFVEPVLSAWTPAAVRSWFEERGLLSVEEREGRVYPLSNAAASVLDVLRGACARAGVATHAGARVEGVRSLGSEGGFAVELAGGEAVEARKVVVAACAGGASLLASCGHSLEPEQPVLCSLATQTGPIRGLSGVRAKCRLSLLAQSGEELFAEEGELLFRDYGISGIVAFNASRFIRPGCSASIDLMPACSQAKLTELLSQRMRWAPSCEELMQGIFHTQVNRAVLRAAGCKPSLQPREEDARALAAAAKDLRVCVEGPGDAKHAQVTRGGAATGEFCPRTMESQLLPGLYACGECLDVDGPCGGYNLHWAWASGIVAGSAAAKAVRP